MYHNFCLPYASLRLPLLQLDPTNRIDRTKKWRPCTPAMAVGWTDRVWPRCEVLMFRAVATASRRMRSMVAGGSTGKWLEQVTCVLTAGFEGVTMDERATGRS